MSDFKQRSDTLGNPDDAEAALVRWQEAKRLITEPSPAESMYGTLVMSRIIGFVTSWREAS